MTDVRLKGWLIGALAAIAAVLIVVLAFQDRQTAIYVVLLVVGSLGLLIWTLPRIRLGLTAIFLYVQPLVIYLPNTEYGYTKAILSLVVISVLWAIWAGRWIWKGRADLQLTPLIGPVVGVLGAALLSLVNANTFWGDVQYVVLIVYFAGFMLYVANHVERRDDVELLVGTLLGAAALASIYGLLQYFGVVLGTPGESGNSQAIISTFGNRNYLGGFLAYLVAPGLWLLLDGRSTWLRGCTLGVIALITVTLVAIDSDSAWLAYVLSVFVVIVGLISTRDWILLKRTWRWSAGLAATAFGLTLLLDLSTQLWLEDGVVGFSRWLDIAPVVGWAGLLTLALVPLAGLLERVWEAPVKQRLGALGGAVLLATLFLVSPPGQTAVSDVRSVLQSGSAQVRVWDWWVGWHMVADHPVTGIGIGDYKREFLPYKAEFLQTERGAYFQNEVGHIQRAAQAHNEYVQMTAEMGIVGALATAVLIVGLIIGAVRRIRQAGERWQRLALLGLFGGVVAFMSDSIFSFPLHLPANALALVTLVGLIFSPVLGESRGQVSASGTSAQVIAGGVLAIALAVSVFAYRDWRADLLLDAAQNRQQRSGFNAEVESLFRRSAQLAVAPSEALYWLGVIHANQGESLTAQDQAEQARQRFETARQYLEQALPRYNTTNVYFQLARASERLQDYERAQRHLETLLQMAPSDSLERQARQLRALILYQQGQTEEAIRQMQDLVEAHPRSPRLPFTLGQMLADQRQLAAARENFNRALENIHRELRRLERNLSQEGTFPAADVSQWRSEREALEQLKSSVQQWLRRLGP